MAPIYLCIHVGCPSFVVVDIISIINYLVFSGSYDLNHMCSISSNIILI
jgi:hypothetical protein